MTATAILAHNTPEPRAETRPEPFVHPHSPDPRGRALLHAQVARNCIIASEHHRREGRPEWARSCLASAGVSRRLAAYEFRAARGG